PLFPYTTLFRSGRLPDRRDGGAVAPVYRLLRPRAVRAGETVVPGGRGAVSEVLSVCRVQAVADDHRRRGAQRARSLAAVRRGRHPHSRACQGLRSSLGANDRRCSPRTRGARGQRSACPRLCPGGRTNRSATRFALTRSLRPDATGRTRPGDRPVEAVRRGKPGPRVQARWGYLVVVAGFAVRSAVQPADRGEALRSTAARAQIVAVVLQRRRRAVAGRAHGAWRL